MDKNIILIGMPSSGKSTLGRRLAGRLGYTFLDTDEVIKQQNGCALQDIIDREGLDAFRLRERQAVLSVTVFCNLRVQMTAERTADGAYRSLPRYAPSDN